MDYPPEEEPMMDDTISNFEEYSDDESELGISGFGMKLKDWLGPSIGVVVLAIVLLIVYLNWPSIKAMFSGSSKASVNVTAPPPSVDAAAAGGASFGRMMNRFGRARRSGF
jgi:hypothetical protein